MSEGLLQESVPTLPGGNSPVSTAPKQNQQREASERLMRSILLNNEANQNQSLPPVLSQQKFRNLNLKNDKRPPRPANTRVSLNGQVPHTEPPPFISNGDAKRNLDDKFMKKDCHGSGSVSERREKHTRNKDRADHGVCTSHHSDVQHTKEEHMSSAMFQQTALHSDSVGVIFCYCLRCMM